MTAPRMFIRTEDRPLGAYVVDVKVAVDHDGPWLEGVLTLDDIQNLRLHFDNAERSLRQRLAEDAACGDCDQCENTRTVSVERFGRDWSEHCPRCRPLLDALAAKVKATS